MLSFSDIHREKIDITAMENRLDEKYSQLNIPLQDKLREHNRDIWNIRGTLMMQFDKQLSKLREEVDEALGKGYGPERSGFIKR